MSLPDPLYQYADSIEFPTLLQHRRSAKKTRISKEIWTPTHLMLDKLHNLELQYTLNSSGSSITFSPTPEMPASVQAEAHAVLDAILPHLTPWRTGPFAIDACMIDGEWNSFYKWDRIAPLIEPDKYDRMLDVGCGNGYFLFKLCGHHQAYPPSVVAGVDPVERCALQFDLLQTFAQEPSITFEPIGIRDLHLFPHFFDLTLCMGVLYHQRDPLGALSSLHASLRTEGTLILETLVFPGDESVAFSPPDRYAKMNNVWFLPTVPCLAGWLQRSGFREIECVRVDITTPEEQRATALAPYESLIDFLNPNDRHQTVEGLPAPHRAIFRAQCAR